MTRWANPSPLLGRVLERSLAGVLAATILLLTVLSVSPVAHERLHADAGDANHRCAVTLFAQGITPAVSQIDLPLPLERPSVVARMAGPELRWAAPRYWLRPLRGPPVS